MPCVPHGEPKGRIGRSWSSVTARCGAGGAVGKLNGQASTPWLASLAAIDHPRPPAPPARSPADSATLSATAPKPLEPEEHVVELGGPSEDRPAPALHSDPAPTLRHHVRLTTAVRAKVVSGRDDVTRATLERAEEKIHDDTQHLRDNVVALASRRR